ncbi:MAG: branched-chain amino acid ABC transporter substrate-binding protein [Gemmatimonadaceae bacterium]|nr:branched-chain amino acid ABC transporter substrate-binding protein [Gemmatimonadaceae bacterium]
MIHHPHRTRLERARRGGALLALTLAAACQNATRTTGVPVGIGIGAVPGTPGYTSITQGVELAIEQLKAEGATFRLRAPAPDAKSAVQVAQQLSADPAVLAVIGHPESGNTLETVPVYADAEHQGADGVVILSPTATSPRLTGVSPWFFRIAPSDADVARFAASWVLDSLSARRAAVIYRNDSYGRDWTETFARAFAPGGQIILREPYLTGAVEWDAYAALLAKVRPDVVLFPGDADDALALIQALRELNVTIPFVGGDGTEAIKQAADAEGAHYVTFFSAAQATGAEAERFLARYRERYHTDPDYFAAQAYDAALVIGRTATRGARTRTALRLALEKVGGDAPSIDGAGGPIGFRRNHDVQARRLFVARVAPLAEGTP